MEPSAERDPIEQLADSFLAGKGVCFGYCLGTLHFMDGTESDAVVLNTQPENDLAVVLDHSQVMGVGHRVRETRRIADAEHAADPKSSGRDAVDAVPAGAPLWLSVTGSEKPTSEPTFTV